jgi:hypothetical protein
MVILRHAQMWVRKIFDDRSPAQPGGSSSFVRLTSTDAMVADTIDGDKLETLGAVTTGPMVPI